MLMLEKLYQWNIDDTRYEAWMLLGQGTKETLDKMLDLHLNDIYTLVTENNSYVPYNGMLEFRVTVVGNPTIPPPTIKRMKS